MASTIPTDVPKVFRSGVTVKFTRSFSDYPVSDSWGYDIHIRGESALDVQGVVAGNEFSVTLAAAETKNLKAGTYRYVERVNKSGEVYDVGEGVIEVLLDLAEALSGEAQTHAEKTLAVIEAALSGRITDGIQSYQIAGRAVNKIPIEELLKLRGHYASMVWRERNPGRLTVPVEVQFGTTS